MQLPVLLFIYSPSFFGFISREFFAARSDNAIIAVGEYTVSTCFWSKVNLATALRIEDKDAGSHSGFQAAEI